MFVAAGYYTVHLCCPLMRESRIGISLRKGFNGEGLKLVGWEGSGGNIFSFDRTFYYSRETGAFPIDLISSWDTRDVERKRCNMKYMECLFKHVLE